MAVTLTVATALNLWNLFMFIIPYLDAVVPWVVFRMYENLRVPPPPVRMRTKFYTSGIDNPNYMNKIKDDAVLKSVEKNLSYMTISEGTDSLSSSKSRTAKPKTKYMLRGKAEGSSVKRSASKSLSNLSKITENDSFFSGSKRFDNNFRNFSVTSTLNPGTRITSKSSFNLGRGKGSRTVVEVKTDPSNCCVHKNLVTNDKTLRFTKPRYLSSSYVCFDDGNWSLHTGNCLKTLNKGKWASNGTKCAFGWVSWLFFFVFLI